jgi:hypothetical protein
MTVRLLSLLLESSLIELLQAEGADEMFRVELPEHGGDAATGNRFVAAGAQRAAESVEVGLAVGPVLVLEEVPLVEGLSTRHTDETTWEE